MTDRTKEGDAGKPAGAEAVRSVAFVGQPEYFRCMYERDLDARYEVREFVLGWGKDTGHYRELIKFDPDVTFFFRPELYPPALLEVLGGVKVALSSEPIPKYVMGHRITSGDMSYRFDSLTAARNRYDFFFHYDRTSLRFLLEQGFRVDGEFLFPVATGLYRPVPCRKCWDWGFFGRDTPHRERFLGLAKRDFQALHVAHGVFGWEFVRLMNRCRIGVNVHVDANLSLEHRMHNMMACGVMVMSEPLSHNALLKPGVHYVEFSQPDEFREKLAHYLAHDGERERIAAAGLELIRTRLAAEPSFTRLIGHVSRPRTEGLFCNYDPLPGEVRAAEGHPAVSLVRLNGVLAPAAPVRRGAVSRWRSWVERTMPRGTARRAAYNGAVRWVRRRLGDEAKPLGDTLRDWVVRDPAAPPAPAGKQSLQAILCDSARRLGLPAGAPSMLIVLPSQSISGGTMVLCEHASRLIRRGYNVVLVDNLLAGEGRFNLDWFPQQQATVVPVTGIHFDAFLDYAMATHWTTAATAIELPARRRLYFVQSNEIRFHAADSVEAKLTRETYSMEFEYLVIARWLQDWLKTEFHKEARYIPNAVHESHFYPDRTLKPRGKRLRVLLEGAIDYPLKGMEDAFRAVEGLDCEVWCVSSQGKPRPGWHCDRFFHRVPLNQMRRIYSSCDVLLKMSRMEGFFLPPLEMMACGGTVVTGKVTGYDEYIVDGQNALVVEQGDVPGARRCLQRLIDDRRLLADLKLHGRETAVQWRWERSSDALIEALRGERARTPASPHAQGADSPESKNTDSTLTVFPPREDRAA